MTLDEADVVVVGAGHNSLIAAGYLALAGYEIVVVEAEATIGGNTITEELTLPGFWHDACSSAHVLLQSNPLLRHDELGLRRYGLRYAHPDPVVVMTFDGDDSLTLWQDTAQTADEFARFSTADARAYRELLRDWSLLKGVHSGVNNQAPGTTELPNGEAARAYAKLRERSAWDVVHERFEHPAVRSLLLWLASATIQPVTRPGTGILPFAITAGRAEFGWATPIGGSGALPAALKAMITAHGGRIVTGAPIERILVSGGGRATGVGTAGGGRYEARRAVLSGIHAAQLPSVLDTGALPDTFVERVSAWEPGLTLFAVHLALDRAPSHRLAQGARSVVASGRGTTAGLLHHLDAMRARRCYSTDPWLLGACSSLVDPSRAPEGQHTLKLLTMAPYAVDGNPDNWERLREPYADAIVTCFARGAANFEPGDELARYAEAPVDLERRNRHNHRGSCHGGDLSPEQSGANRPVPGWSDYRLPVGGLYHTGSTAHPGGSVSGRPGRNAARVLLTDLGEDPYRWMAGP